MDEDEVVWMGMAKDDAYGSWRAVDIRMDEDGNLTLYEDGEYNDAVYSLDDLFQDYIEFADDVIPVNSVTKDDLIALWGDHKK